MSKINVEQFKLVTKTTMKEACEAINTNYLSFLNRNSHNTVSQAIMDELASEYFIVFDYDDNTDEYYARKKIECDPSIVIKDIEVGDYICLKVCGDIRKIKEIKIKRGQSIYITDEEFVFNDESPSSNECYDDMILKKSNTLLGIIGVGDFVNNKTVALITDRHVIMEEHDSAGEQYAYTEEEIISVMTRTKYVKSTYYA